MSLPNPTDPSLPTNSSPLFSDITAARGDHLRGNNSQIWGNFNYLYNLNPGYIIDQNLRTTDNVNFSSIIISNDSKINGVTAGLGAGSISNNSAFGVNSLISNTTGSSNSAFGYQSLYLNTIGTSNSAFGYQSLYSNTTGNNNSAFGVNSLYSNTTGSSNSAFGISSLNSNTTGFRNSAFGENSLISNTIGFNNSAFGMNSLNANTIGSYNSAFGENSGSSIIGGSYNLCLGYNSQTSSATSNGQVVLGDANISIIRCNVTSISSLSDERDKINIKDTSVGLDFINSIQVREFNWDRRECYLTDDNNDITKVVKDGSKASNKISMGFIAQELKSAQEKFEVEYLNLVHEENPDKMEATPGNLLPVMVKAIQELSLKIDAQNKIIEGLLNK